MKSSKTFFVPFADSPEQVQKAYGDIKARLRQKLGAGFSERKVYCLQWYQNGEHHTAEVGKETSAHGGVVIAILFEPERNLYHVCTPLHGVLEDGPILVGGAFVTDYEDFDK